MVFGLDKNSIIVEVKKSLIEELSKDLKFKRELQGLLGVFSCEAEDIKLMLRDILVRLEATQEQFTILKNRCDNIEDEFFKIKSQQFKGVKKK